MMNDDSEGGSLRRPSLQCFAGVRGIEGDLGAEGVEAWEFLFGAEEAAEGDFEVLAVEVAGEIEEVHFEDALARGVSDRGADADIHDAAMLVLPVPNLDRIHAVGRELLVVCAEVGCGEAEGPAELISVNDGAENGVVASQELGGAGQVAGFDGGADGGAGYDFAIGLDGGDADFVKTEAVTHAAEHFEIAGAAAAETPLVADADFSKGVAGGVQLKDELLRRGGGELRGEGDDENGIDAEGADEAELVGGGGEEAGRAIGAKDFRGMWIKCNCDGIAAGGAGIGKGPE